MNERDEEDQMRAVDEIARILCGEDEPDEGLIAIPRGDEAIQWTQEEPASDAETAEKQHSEQRNAEAPIWTESLIAPADSQEENERHSLALYNYAIDALERLMEDGVGFEIREALENTTACLKEARMNTFEHMIPWAQIARGKAK